MLLPHIRGWLSLRYRLLFPLVFLLVAEVVGTSWAARLAIHSADRRIADQLQAIGRTLHEPPVFPLTPRVLHQMRGLSGAEFLLVQSDGGAIATFNGLPPIPEPRTITEDDQHLLGPVAIIQGVSYRFLPIMLQAPHPGAGGTLYIFYPEELRLAAIWSAVRPPLLLGFVSVVAALILMLTMGRHLVYRLQELGNQTRIIAGGNFHPITVPPRKDEVGDLYQAINEMAARLAEFEVELKSTERLRILGQFSAGLAHQLRNAAAGAKLAVQLHAADCPGADQESLDVALRQLSRIESNLRQFLDLAKPHELVWETCHLAAIISSAVDLLRPQCRHAGTELIWKTPPIDTGFLGDATHLGHLVGNLIGNAVEAAGTGGHVTIELERTAGGWAIVVADTGPGPPAAIADRLFEPFVTGREQGIGLGLTVVKQAVTAHHGTVDWTRRDGRTIFRVTLPDHAENRTSFT